MNDLPSPDDILNAHNEIEEAYDMKYTGTRVASPRLELKEMLEDVDEYGPVYKRAACLLRRIITDHIFEDGNKRTAWVVSREYLLRYGIEPAVNPEEVERVLRRIRRYEIEEIADWLNTGSLDRDRLSP